MKTTKYNIAMKAILIIIAIFGIQVSTVVASNIGNEVIPTEPNNLFCPECPVLLPEVPMEAPFSEVIEFESSMNLNPVVPMEATFDYNIEVELTGKSLAPISPLQADFDDTMTLPIEQGKSLVPVVPMTADFSDSL